MGATGAISGDHGAVVGRSRIGRCHLDDRHSGVGDQQQALAPGGVVPTGPSRAQDGARVDWQRAGRGTWSLQQVESDVEANVLLGDLRCGTRGTALSMEHRLVNAIYGDDATTAYTVGTSGGRLEVSVNGVKMIANPPSGSGSTAGIGGSRPAMRSAPADRSALRRSDCGAAAIGFTVSTDGTSTTVQFATPPQGSNFVVVAMTRGWCSRPEPRWSAALRCSGRCLIECCTSEVLRCKLQMKRRIALPHLGDLGCYCLQSRLISPEHSSRETSIDYFH